MRDLRQIESVHEILRSGQFLCVNDSQYLVSGELLGELSAELQKGQRARYLLEELATYKDS